MLLPSMELSMPGPKDELLLPRYLAMSCIEFPLAESERPLKIVFAPSLLEALLLMAPNNRGRPIYRADLVDCSSAPTLLLIKERLSPAISCSNAILTTESIKSSPNEQLRYVLAMHICSNEY